MCIGKIEVVRTEVLPGEAEGQKVIRLVLGTENIRCRLEIEGKIHLWNTGLQNP